MMNKAVFLDRDGTLIEYHAIVSDPGMVVLLPGVGKAVADLNRTGYLCVVATNQPEIEKGNLTMKQVDAVNTELSRQLAAFGAHIDKFYICPHRFNSGASCPCRKPGIGMLQQAVAELGVDFSQSFMVGDSMRDVMTGNNAKIPAILVLAGVGGQGDDAKYFPDARPDYAVKDLAEAAAVILKQP